MAIINGERVQATGKNLMTYLEEEGYELNRIVVERNLEIIPKEKIADITIEDEDMIEILRFVGGG